MYVPTYHIGTYLHNVFLKIRILERKLLRQVFATLVNRLEVQLNLLVAKATPCNTLRYANLPTYRLQCE